MQNHFQPIFSPPFPAEGVFFGFQVLYIVLQKTQHSLGYQIISVEKQALIYVKQVIFSDHYYSLQSKKFRTVFRRFSSFLSRVLLQKKHHTLRYKIISYIIYLSSFPPISFPILLSKSFHFLLLQYIPNPVLLANSLSFLLFYPYSRLEVQQGIRATTQSLYICRNFA